jgi:hypothetical protein
MNWYFVFAMAAAVGFIFITLDHPYAGLFVVGGAYGAALYKLLEDA